MTNLFARLAQVALCLLLFCYAAVPAAAITLPVPFLQSEECMDFGGDMPERLTYLGPLPNGATSPCLSLVERPSNVPVVIDMPPTCSVWRIEEPAPQNCRAPEGRVQGAVLEAGSPRALGALVAALATPVESDIDPLMKPTPPLLMAEWALVLTIVALGLFKIALGRRE